MATRAHQCARFRKRADARQKACRPGYFAGFRDQMFSFVNIGVCDRSPFQTPAAPRAPDSWLSRNTAAAGRKQNASRPP
ncbi:hypothetical protein AX27061_4227 [Achromobacter xylosoxidans NBRC 15126 = ATCC 27061]|nr:hypothetical protein AX27061_4227 [Achromobacter xylosoxidans NBRC 15126 = ATCC 27061]